MAKVPNKRSRSRRFKRRVADHAIVDADHRKRRLEMVTHQIKSRDVNDPAVLAAIASVPRHRFVHESQTAVAYQDHPLPIAANQTISQPYMVALMAQAAAITPGDRVLEVGTGSGYGAAVLATLAREVITVERHQDLANPAAALLTELGYRNVTVVNADGSHGYPESAPYSAVVVTASASKIPSRLVDQLADGGRLIIPIGPVGDIQQLVRLHKTGDRHHIENLCPVRFVPLIEECQDDTIPPPRSPSPS